MNADIKRALEEGDFRLLRRLHAAALSHLPGPNSDAEAEMTLHVARTASAWLELKKRAYSHRWLVERGLPSQLPDELKPKAERIYPKVVSAVGISVNSNSELMQPIIPIIRGAMERAVLEADADGKLLDSVHVSARMKEARETAFREIFGATAEKLKA
jgi:hypothetical protein